MKAKELSDLLIKYPDFDVKIAYCKIDDSEYGMTVHSFDITGIGDIGHSSKVLQLDFEWVF